jgi:hypothetical protein
MVSRAYLLLDIADDKVEEAVRKLRSNSGVMRIDILESSPGLFVIVEAPGRKGLTELTLRAFASVKDLTGEVLLLPVKEKSFETDFQGYRGLKKATGLKKAR